MAGRKPKPAAILKFEKKSHKTKAELDAREAAELKIGEQVFTMPAIIRRDPAAAGVWEKVVEIFSDPAMGQLVTNVDVAIIATYCVTVADYTRLNLHRDLESVKTRARLALTINKLAGELFLTPMARIRNTKPRKPEEDDDPLKQSGFGDI